MFFHKTDHKISGEFRLNLKVSLALKNDFSQAKSDFSNQTNLA